jgi:hypothetical protein
MISLVSLWLPVLLAAVLAFVASAVMHMVLKYHQNDFAAVPRENEVAAALRPFAIPPGDYHIPHGGSADMKTPEFQEKLRQGPVVMLTVFPNGPFAMGKMLVQWFLFCVVVSIVAGYVAGRTVPAGTEYLHVFRVTGTVAFAGYGLALVQDSIWYGRRWGSTVKSLVDSLIYALLTAGSFGWLWP